jgi:uncharacterized protein YbaR (Trm112 family)
MKTDFLCPNCKGYLSVGENIVFTVKGKDEKNGILFLSPKLGDYTYSVNPNFSIEKGEELEFFCPICHADLSVSGAEKLARVILREESRYEYYIVFSRKEGERCTYKLSEKSIDTYGEAAHKYVDFVNASLMK